MTGADDRSEADRCAGLLLASPLPARVLEGLRALDLPQGRLVSGAVYQTIWNALTGRPADHGVRDFDIFYFDGSDLSWAAEDQVIRRAETAFGPDLAPRVQVRNQARVHLWFERRFGEAYAPLASADAALERFVAPAFAVGARLEADGTLAFAAPFGWGDVLSMTIRPNPRRPRSAHFDRIAGDLLSRWPEAIVRAD